MVTPKQQPAATVINFTEKQGLSRWLAKRQGLLAIYWKLSGLALLNDETATEEELAWFSSTLVDYLAEGQFSIYARLIKDISEYLPDAQPKIDFLYASLLNSTLSLVDISDQAAQLSLKDFATLHDSLFAHFGHDWAHHLEMEDNLIKYWHQANECAFSLEENSLQKGS